MRKYDTHKTRILVVNVQQRITGPTKKWHPYLETLSRLHPRPLNTFRKQRCYNSNLASLNAINAPEKKVCRSGGLWKNLRSGIALAHCL
ncbi:hypothetical protein CEXT_209201 [Caerostris extrusa]|uniref:Uncharacterized protein n=1 Tax=Caerostris extrusa TaxID=172846 RepID=A0AAV4P261_CAEEX|nr:hypothetical protein CEXT_209201 [Caerostris extrusa]